MLGFLLKGILRDRSRSLFPVITVMAGVLIFVFYHGFMDGYEVSIIRQNARFETGHLKIVTRAYAEMIDQKPYDLGFLGIQADLSRWKKQYPEYNWMPRINFGALLDVPDEEGKTREQGETFVYGVDLLSSNKTLEYDALHLEKALKRGSLPMKSGDILLSDNSFTLLKLKLGDRVSLISSTLNGAMAIRNFNVVGTVVFNTELLDRGGAIADISDIRELLDMPEGAAEILAIHKSGRYNQREVAAIRDEFNSKYCPADEFPPLMLTLGDQNNLGFMLAYMRKMMWIMNLVFMFILGIILWNAGLMNGIRRYGEIGVRLAIGEEKRHIYYALLTEALVIGIIGGLIGAALGLLISYVFNHIGMDMTAYNRNSSVLSENVIYVSFSIKACLMGLIPGIGATILGTALAGIAIIRRQTSQLFKELEA